jgi:hypothetical protein
MKNPRFIKEYLSDNDLFTIKSFKTTNNQIVIETKNNSANDLFSTQIIISKETAIDMANDLLQKANQLE